MNKPRLYDEVEVQNFDFEKIELGGHKGVIKKAEEYTSPISNKTSLKVYVDTAKDDIQPEYFTEQYRNNTREDKQWSSSAIKYISLGEEENQVKMLKGFITAWENSNGKEYNWSKDLSQLKDTKIGLVFGLEEYEGQDGKIRTNAKLRDFRSLDKIDSVKIPKVKLINNSYVDYEEYSKKDNSNSSYDDFSIEITPDALPF